MARVSSPLPSLAIFVPAYNAAATLPDLLARVPADLWPTISAIFVIDDGSQDDTGAVARALATRRPKVRLVTQPRNLGYGRTVRNGLRLCVAETDADAIACLHADGQYPPEALPRFISYMAEHGVDVLQGSRHKDGTALAGGMPRYKWLAGKTLTALENWSFSLAMTDYHSGFIVYSRHAAETIPFDGLSDYFDFDLEVIATARALGLSLDELGIPTHYGEVHSHLSVARYGLRCLRVIIGYRLGRYGARLTANTD
ncbi:MAG: glycosyltransferase family 2 protein [Hyphomicrobiales bacterium]|nr:glycosyltransferase family 2 protein [Hyphomicrobiales bacterium]